MQVDWSRFDETHGGDKRAAFEALAEQLFERFCKREHGPTLLDVRFVEGKGGDGGVEAYAVLGSGEEIGLQAKWHREAFGAKQIVQIEESLRAAIANHPRLVRYIVAIPRNLGDRRDKGAKGASSARRRESTERQRWNSLLEKAKRIAPTTEVVLWDDARIQGLLGEPENEGLYKYWFTPNVITLDELKQRFEEAKGGWLGPLYLPELHAACALEEDLSLRTGDRNARGALLREVRAAMDELSEVRFRVDQLQRHPDFLDGVPDSRALREQGLEILDGLIVAGKALQDALSGGDRLHVSFPVSHGSELLVLSNLAGALSTLKPGAGLHCASTQNILESLQRVVHAEDPPQRVLLRIWERWRGSARSAAYVGDPGVGKTHGLAHAVESYLGSGLPGLLLRAKQCKLDEGWAGILRRALDRPNLQIVELLNALEALAARGDGRLSRRSAAQAQGVASSDVVEAPTCFLLAVDGLEESGAHERWAELLAELAVHLDRHPRLRVAITLRTKSHAAILRCAKSEMFDTIWLPNDPSEVQHLLRMYCSHWNVPLPDRRLRWAIRDARSVRLYCELARQRQGWDPRRQELSLPSLLGAKLEHAEEAMRQAGGWSPRVKPLHTALRVVTSHCVEHGALTRGDAIHAAKAAMDASGSLTPEQWSSLFDQAEEHGLLLASTKGTTRLQEQPVCHVEPAYEPLTDYLIAEAACATILSARARGERPKLGGQLARRPDAREQVAILMAREGVGLIDSGVWNGELRMDQLEELELCAIASLDDEAAKSYADWVRDRLRSSMPSCRRVLAKLCAPLSRDEAHPFGPRFVHDALLPLLPAQRDVFWSGPSDLPVDSGKPWEGYGPSALERLRLESDDRADGPPLLLAWALTSVDSRWRRRLRAELALWGSRQLDELVRWLDLTFDTNDPQMAEDIAMVAFGAACLAEADSRLGELAAWVDAKLLAPDAPHRREDIVVLHAARGVVERARFMGAAVAPSALEHAKRLYSTKPDLLSIDAEAAKEADDHWGVLPLSWDLAFYVVPGAIQPFFDVEARGGLRALDPRAQHLLSLHAEAIHLDSLSPQKLAFGGIIAHLRAMGWDGRLENEMDAAIAGRYQQETHGRRSPVCTLAEKYVWTGCHLIQAYLAGRLPAKANEAASTVASERWIEPPVDPVLVSDLIPNPASDAWAREAEVKDSWSFWADEGIVPSVDLTTGVQADRADEWVRRAPWPDLRPWIHLPGHAAPPWSLDKDWFVLFCEVVATERDSQAYSHLRVASFVVPEEAAAALKVEAHTWPTWRRRDLSGHTEGVRCRLYADPFDACWAPWATGVHGVEPMSMGRAPGEPTRVGGDPQAASAVVAWCGERGEATMRLPAQWLRAALGFREPERRASPGGEQWRFVDRHGEVHAVYTRAGSGWDRSEAVLIRRSSLQRALAGRGQVLAWAAWLFRQPRPHLYDEDRERLNPYERRDHEWLAVLIQSEPDVFELPPFNAADSASTAPEREPTTEKVHGSEAQPLVPVGPTNPGLATKLEMELDDENAIPYFLWDDPMTVGELRQRLSTASPPERDRLLGKILREARDPDVWRFTSPDEVAARFDALSRHLGRRRAFWKFLLDCWEREGLLVRKSA